VRCAPPSNHPTTEERDACAPFLARELQLVPWRAALVPAFALRVALTGGSAVGVMATEDGDRVTLDWHAERGPKSARRRVEYYAVVHAPTGTYPDWRSLAPSDEYAVTWSVGDAAGTATALGTLANRQNVPAILEPSGSAVRATAAFGPDESRTVELTMTATGPAFSVGVNPRFLADALELTGDGATVRVRDGLRALHVEGDGTYALVMPMRVG
jgi:hypothetical protein